MGSFINMMMGDSKPKQPETGMGVTELCFSDRHPWTVIQVKSPRLVKIQLDRAVRVDKNGMSDSQRYEFYRDEEGPTMWISLRKDGRWRKVGSKDLFFMGERSKYHDYSF